MSKISKVEEAYNRGISTKYGLQKLEVEPVSRTVDLIDKGKPAAPSKYDAEFKQAIKDKFGVEKLSFDGALGRRLTERTLESASQETAREQMQGRELSCASVTYKQQPLRIWFEISR